ncbi:MAG TPA: hypothetical protein VGS22_07275 [Thermoanaerobaculia bacterium]|jgi:hypothetical protein|nr:hypothetical protein [Thermoanaerobaculia bacterium]
MSDDLSAKILEELAGLRRTTEGLGAKQEELRLGLQSVAQELGAKVDDSRREFGVITEGLRSEIQQVAEGVILNGERIDRLQAETAREFAETRSMFRLSYTEHGCRIRILEDSSESHETRLQRLESAATV